ncbi:MAG: hypothetical protein Kow0092_22290 [Deferrisomatales bacterium]
MGNPWGDQERFRQLVLELGLPRPGTAYVGLRCPYCGKADRIHRLERPEELADPPVAYGELWRRYGAGGELVVCTFCRQLLQRRAGDGVVALPDGPEEGCR